MNEDPGLLSNNATKVFNFSFWCNAQTLTGSDSYQLMFCSQIFGFRDVLASSKLALCYERYDTELSTMREIQKHRPWKDFLEMFNPEEPMKHLQHAAIKNPTNKTLKFWNVL